MQFMRKCSWLLFLLPCFLMAEETFHFAVLSDRSGSVNQQAFEMVVQDIERLHPDFIVTVGDLADDALLEQYEMAMQTMQQLTCPVYYTPGNNDIVDAKTAELFTQQTGAQPYYSFDYTNTHFIVLNNAIAESYAEMENAQKQWLHSDLVAHQNAENIYVLMHKPFWANGIAQGQPDSLHALLKTYHVDAVFTGHWHQYAHNEYDGIEYFLAGSSGGGWGMSEENVDLGCFYQFLWCTVQGDQLHTSIIKAGSTFAKDLVTIEEEQMTYQIPNHLIKATAKIENTGQSTAHIHIENTTDQTIEQILLLESPQGNWKIAQTETPITILANESYETNISLTQSGSLFPLPTMKFHYPFGRNKVFPYQQPIQVQRVIQAVQAKQSIQLDGKLKDAAWQKAEFVTEFCDFSGNATNSDRTKLAIAYDQTYLYLAVECEDAEMDQLACRMTEPDQPVYQDDCVGFLWSCEEKIIHQMYINAQGVVWDMKVDLRNGTTDESWNSEMETATHHTSDGWTVEIKIPRQNIGCQESISTLQWNFRRKQQRNQSSALLTNGWSYQPNQYGQLVLIPYQ